MKIKVLRCICVGFFALMLIVSTAFADSWTVYPTTETNCTGYTDFEAKHDGPILIYGGATTGTVRKGNGYLKFDVSTIPDSTPVTSIGWNFYVSAANWPYWSVTPVSLDPVPLPSTAALLWDDVQAEMNTGYYNYLSEGSTYAPGWKQLVLGGSANADLIALLAVGQDWFAFGGVSRDNVSTYYLEIDGHDGLNVPYLVVMDNPPPANDTCAGAIVIPGAPGSYSYTGDTTFATDDYDCSAACVGGLSHGDKDVAYTVTLPAGCEICVTLNQSEMTWNGGVYMVTDCADVNGTCVAGASGWTGGVDETFCYTDTATETYYIIVDGRDVGGSGPFQLDVDISCIVGPSGMTCVEDGIGGVDLSWTNNDTYTSIEVYENDVLIQTLAGTATSTNVATPTKGYSCYYVCGVVGGDSACTDDCCLIVGYDPELLWDFEGDDGGLVVDGTGSWEWGEATYGPCFETAEGKVWATNLDSDYVNNACWLLDSPPVPLWATGCFLSIDHCYDMESGYDGGVVWFTTDDYWYYTFEPVKGSDGVITANPDCTWVAGQNGFTGDSGGWVTDHWDLTDPKWQSQDVRIRLAFGADSSVNAPGWMIDNVTIYYHYPIWKQCDYTIVPVTGTVPFQTVHQVTLYNNLTGGVALTRRIAGRIAVTLANGSSYNPWRAGYTNIAPGCTYSTQFSVNIPALASVIGSNTFVLSSMDVTPAPYNQPPYPPAGNTCTRTRTVEASAP